MFGTVMISDRSVRKLFVVALRVKFFGVLILIMFHWFYVTVRYSGYMNPCSGHVFGSGYVGSVICSKCQGTCRSVLN